MVSVNIVNMVKLPAGRGANFAEKNFFSCKTPRKSEFHVHTPSQCSQMAFRPHPGPHTPLHNAYFVNIVKECEEGLFKRFFWNIAIVKPGRCEHQKTPNFTMFTMFTDWSEMTAENPKVLYTRFWWKRLYQRYAKTRGAKKRARLRAEMRSVARNLVEFMQEAGCE